MDSLNENTCLVPLAVSNDSVAIALKWIRNLDDSAWGAVNARSNDRSRIKFTSRHFYGEAEAWSTRVPPELMVLGQEAVEAARSKTPDAPWDKFAIDTLVLNRYHKGKGVSAHRDPSKWVPLVVGVTLYDDPFGPLSAMRFAEGRESLIVPTPHGSAYVFHGRAYTKATHARKKCAARQKGNVYSLTFRSYA